LDQRAEVTQPCTELSVAAEAVNQVLDLIHQIVGRSAAEFFDKFFGVFVGLVQVAVIFSLLLNILFNTLELVLQVVEDVKQRLDAGLKIVAGIQSAEHMEQLESQLVLSLLGQRDAVRRRQVASEFPVGIQF
jgi:uncharacterized membrane protein required for colicin V production